jgi:hypothetical protein
MATDTGCGNEPTWNRVRFKSGRRDVLDDILADGLVTKCEGLFEPTYQRHRIMLDTE